MLKSIVRVFIVTLLLAVTGACGSTSQPAESKALKINRFKGGDFTAHVLDKKGFFEREGIEIEWTDVNTGPQAVNALLSGSLDMLFGNLVLTSGPLSQGQELEVVSGGVAPPFSIIAAKGADAQAWPASVKALKGGSIGVPTLGAAAEWYSRYIVKQAGVDPDSVTYEATGGLQQSQAALESGTVSAIFAAPAQDAVLRADGYPVIFSWMEEDAYEGSAPESLTALSSYSDFDYWATSEWAEGNPDQVAGFQRAMQKGAEWLKDPANLEEIVATVRDSEYDLSTMDDKLFTAYVQTTIDTFTPDYSVAAGNAYVTMLRNVGAPNANKLPAADEWSE